MTGREVVIRLRGIEVVGVSSLYVELSTGLEADIFRARIPNPGGQYTGLFVTKGEMQQRALSAEERKKLFDGEQVDVEIAGEVCFRGLCDDARILAIPTPGIELTGRDFSARLIDETVSPQLSEAVSNVTSSVAVTRIANAFKLTPRVDRTTRVWGEQSAFGAGVSPWSVVAELAGKEGFDAYVTGGEGGPELVFRKRVMPSTVARTITVPATEGSRDQGIEGSSVPEELEFYTAKTMGLGFKVRVVGHDPKRNQSIVFTAESPLRNRPNYRVLEVVDRSLQTRDQVSARAWAELLGVSKGLVTGRYRGAIDGGLRPGSEVEVRYEGRGAGGEGEPLAGTYFVEKVRHQLSEQGEFTTEVEFASKPLASGTVEEIERATEEEKSGRLPSWGK